MNSSYGFYFALIGSMALIAIIFSSRFFSFIDQNNRPERDNHLDGLRFLLASFVIFHHMDFYYNLFNNGHWASHSLGIIYLGRSGVALFFMITAYLFWGKIKNKDYVNWLELYKNRFFRIAPLSFFVSTLAIVIILIKTKWDLTVPLTTQSIASWFDAGLFDRKMPINGFNESRLVIAGVTWTLRWEWLYYMALPALFLLRKSGMALSMSLFFGSIFILREFFDNYHLWSYFFAGMLASDIKDSINAKKLVLWPYFFSALAILYLITPSPNTQAFIIILSAVFITICLGFDGFGLFNTRGFIRLGHISYSLYLNQGIILYPFFYFLHGKISALTLYPLFFLSFLAISIFSSITYRFIEIPFINLGRRI